MCLVVLELGEGLMRAGGVDLGERRYEDREVQLLGKKTWTSCLIQMIFSLPIPALTFWLLGGHLPCTAVQEVGQGGESSMSVGQKEGLLQHPSYS